MQQKAVIQELTRRSPLASYGVRAGWVLRSINGQPIRDIIDYRLAEAGTSLTLILEDAEGAERVIRLEKEYDRTLGLNFDSPTIDRVKTCINRCAFCFVDQMPSGLRPSLYIKDDDYRLSFLSGSYITLSNLTSKDLERIVALKLSPLFVSVHAYDAVVRDDLLGYKASDFWERFDYLIAGNIGLHCQIVACPGRNDGTVLEETLRHLAARRPGVLTVTIVPVGLTQHRKWLKPLRVFRRDEAEGILQQVDHFSAEAVVQGYGSWIWAADEFYLLAECLERLPVAEAYEGYPHFENGVGMLRSFWEEWQALKPLPEAVETRPVLLLTGVSGGVALEPIMKDLRLRLDRVELRVIVNRLFGSDVTVTGLLSGSDIQEQQSPQSSAGQLLLLPDVVMQSGGSLFLDGISLEEMQDRYAQAGAELRVIPATAQGLYRALFASRTAVRRPVRRSFL